VQSLVKTSRQTPNFGVQHGAGARLVTSGSTRPGPAARVVDSASYQALLVNLGLEPDPRLCVPAVRR
jgi:hypothetical protein